MSKQVSYVRPNLNWISVPKTDHTYDYQIDRMGKIYKKNNAPPPQFAEVKAIGIPDYWRNTNLVWPRG